MCRLGYNASHAIDCNLITVFQCDGLGGIRFIVGSATQNNHAGFFRWWASAKKTAVGKIEKKVMNKMMLNNRVCLSIIKNQTKKFIYENSNSTQLDARTKFHKNFLSSRLHLKTKPINDFWKPTAEKVRGRL